MKFVMSYSGGKDSALALYYMVAQGHVPVALITTVNAQQQRSWFHGIPLELLQLVSDSLNIPLITCDCVMEEYTLAFENALQEARAMGAEACAFGDIDIEGHKTWNEERCRNTGLACQLPLWHIDREAATRRGISLGFQSMIKIIQCDVLNQSFLGRTLSLSVLETIKGTGADVCGENGEYHTFVYNGPLFSYPLPIKAGDIIDLGTHKAISILLDNDSR